jgi:hypothetical protein
LEVLLVHLLKWQFQPIRSSGWRGTIAEQRRRISLILALHPALARRLPELVNVRYSRAKALASEQTGLQASTFPSKCPYAVHEIIDFDFLPGRNA